MTRTGFTPRRLLTTIAIATSVACSSTHEPRTTTPDAPTGGVALSPAGQAMAGIETQEVAVESAGPTLEAVGTVTLDDTRTARIGALVEGIVSRTQVDVGDRVRGGALLAGLHSHDVHDGWGDYRKAVADRRRVEQELAFADETLARTERLLADKAASVMETERARVSQAGARQQLIAATAEVRRAQDSLEHLGIPVDARARSADEIPVRTPRAGVVLERLVTAGTAVTPGTALFVVSDTSSLWVVAEVDEADIGRVSIGSPVEVVVSAYPSERFDARVARIGDTINPTTRRAIVRCTVTNADGRLKPGMFARVTMAGAGTSTRVRVPVDAVQDLGDRRVVFVSDGHGRYTARDVETGPERDGRIDVRHGLAAGDNVVTRGAFLLKSQVLGPSAGEP